jgi:hypothetical protein
MACAVSEPLKDIHWSISEILIETLEGQIRIPKQHHESILASLPSARAIASLSFAAHAAWHRHPASRRRRIYD